MRKQDVINQISEETGIDALTSRSIVESFFEVVQDSLIKGEPIYIRTFGSFIVKRRGPKIARNINQNTAVPIAAHTIPFFKPCPEFVNQVRGRKVSVSTKKAKA